MSKHMARMAVSGELIRQVLALPKGTNIYNIIRDRYNPDTFTFLVEHPDLPEVAEAAAPEEISPIFHMDYEKRPETWITCDWNLKK